MTRSKRARRQVMALAVIVSMAVILSMATAAVGPREASAATGNLGPWMPVSRATRLAANSDQGLASVSTSGGSSKLVYRGDLSIPLSLFLQGWSHVGDPGGWKGYLFDTYQTVGSAREKLFRVTTPTGATRNLVHTLAVGEAPYSSFVTVSPDGQWMVSGEWNTMRRLLVFPTPVLNPAGRGATLPLQTTIALDHPVRDVQGCTFVTGTQVMCSTDDPDTDLWPTPHQLLSVTLPHAENGTPMTATVRSLGELPNGGRCSGSGEVEGIDFQAGSGLLRVDVTPPGLCAATVSIYTYRRAGSPPAAG